jgi:hypothetical protein
MSPNPKVELYQDVGMTQLCTTNTDPVELVISNDSSAQQDANENRINSMTTPSAGVAIFNNFQITRSGTFTIKARSGSIYSTASNSFVVNSPSNSTITQVVWQVPPSSSPPGKAGYPNIEGGGTTVYYTNMYPNFPKARLADQYGNYLGTTSGKNATLYIHDVNENQLGNSTFSDNAKPVVMTNSTSSSADYGSAIFREFGVASNGTYKMRVYVAGSGLNFYTPFATITTSTATPRNTTATLEMIQGPASVKNATLSLGRSRMFTNSFTQTSATWTWKLVASNLNPTQSGTITLVKNASTTPVDVTSITLAANTPVTTFTKDFTNTGTDYIIKIQAGSDGPTTVHSSTIIANQTGASKSMIYIPLTSIEQDLSLSTQTTNASNSTTTPAGNSFTESRTSGTTPNTSKNYLSYNWDGSKIGKILSARLAYVISPTISGSSGQAYVALYNKTTNTLLGTSSLCSTSTCGVNSEVIYYNTGGIAGELVDKLPYLGEIEARVYAANPVKVYKIGLIVTLSDIRKTVAIQNLAGAKSSTNLVNNTNFVENRVISLKDYFGTGTTSESIYCNAKAITNGIGSFVLKDHTTTTLNNTTGITGTSGASSISASTINFTAQSSFTILDAGPLLSNNLNTMFLNFTTSSGSFDLSGCIHQTESNYVD